MGENILSSLSAAYPRRATEPTEQSDQSNPQQDLSDDKGPLALVDDVAVEIITVSDYSEVEVSSGTNVEVVMGENHFTGDSQVVFFKENVIEKEEAKQHMASSQHKAAVGPHDCPHCKKKFKFASSLLAHCVIHTGKRPHHCSDCGRSFSFRQSLDRHRQTHKTGRTYECIICKATFCSLSARTEHKQTHMQDGIYACRQCNKKFTWELSLARHLKAHSDDHSASQPPGSREDQPEAATAVHTISVTNVETDERCPVQGGDGGESFLENARCQSNDPLSSEPGRPVPELDPVKVRTSGRKRVPTMKIQVINLQKRMTTKKRREITVNPPALKTLPFIW